MGCVISCYIIPLARGFLKSITPSKTFLFCCCVHATIRNVLSKHWKKKIKVYIFHLSFIWVYIYVPLWLKKHRRYYVLCVYKLISSIINHLYQKGQKKQTRMENLEPNGILMHGISFDFLNIILENLQF